MIETHYISNLFRTCNQPEEVSLVFYFEDFKKGEPKEDFIKRAEAQLKDNLASALKYLDSYYEEEQKYAQKVADVRTERYGK